MSAPVCHRSRSAARTPSPQVHPSRSVSTRRLPEGDYTLIIGGTSGLGREIALQCLERNVTPIVLGRSAQRAVADQDLKKAVPFTLDLFDLGRLASSIHRLLRFIDQANITHLFWVAGIAQSRPFLDLTRIEIAHLLGVHLEGSLLLLHSLLNQRKERGQPVHLVVVSSTSVYGDCNGNELLNAVQAAKASVARGLASSLLRDVPGSLVSLFMLAAMDTAFHTDRSVDSTSLLQPEQVATIMAVQTGVGHGPTHRPSQMSTVTTPFARFLVERELDGSPRVNLYTAFPDQPF
ncbi:SDR family NAD(P)-dependent oxidoreductase [Candidatus Uhrbacteria bacterium]|nr:SDR family NAD(P)-dependent oxidoreductase [Candidatus Uhrbacteria bacterium]